MLTVQGDHPPLGCLSDEAVASFGDAFSRWWICPVAKFLFCVTYVHTHCAFFEALDGTVDFLEPHMYWIAFVCSCVVRVSESG